MTNSDRLRLENAIIDYGKAVALIEDMWDPASKALAEQSAERAWGYVCFELDAIQQDDEERAGKIAKLIEEVRGW